MFDEHLHQSIHQGDLVGRLSAVFFEYPFERASKEVINMTGRELGTDGCISRGDINSPALHRSGIDFRLQSGGQQVFPKPGLESTRHDRFERRQMDGAGCVTMRPRSAPS